MKNSKRIAALILALLFALAAFSACRKSSCTFKGIGGSVGTGTSDGEDWRNTRN